MVIVGEKINTSRKSNKKSIAFAGWWTQYKAKLTFP